MSRIRRVKIIRIGKSRGFRIPIDWLDQLQPGDDVELALEPDRIVIRASKRPRQGWEEQFQAMAERGDDQPHEPMPSSRWDKHEWEW